MAPGDRHNPPYVWGGDYYTELQLGLYSTGVLILRALSSNKAIHKDNGRLLPSIAIVGLILDVIFSIYEPPTAILATHK
ncbi:hypothetical protein PVK06_040592 [Gossypium arboreum]|uniref:Uncharacterized protein n=1 Tax=Gossypium arboreum TaxID=29729 RepID=A0ABR0N6P0_GOSAR|nr:hypothetical protein PVK06_040592 [Gossypium arboreum]